MRRKAPAKWKEYYTASCPWQSLELSRNQRNVALCPSLPLFACCGEAYIRRTIPPQAIKSLSGLCVVVFGHQNLALSHQLLRKVRMSKIRIAAGSKPGLFLLCRRSAAATVRSAALMLMVALLAGSPVPISAATPDPVLEWIDVMNTTVLTAGTAPNVTSRVVALVSASVFDAVNGIEPRFRPLQVRPDAPHNASQRAAAIQAAYAMLLHLYPAQSATLTTRLNASLMALASTEKVESIAAGVAWGQTVADAIWTSRLTDGFAPTPPPFLGVLGIVGTPGAVGFWRPTPPA